MTTANTMEDTTPAALRAVTSPPMACTTVYRVYSGLVPKSPNTTPSAAKPAQPAAFASSVGRFEEPSSAVDSLCMMSFLGQDFFRGDRNITLLVLALASYSLGAFSSRDSLPQQR